MQKVHKLFYAGFFPTGIFGSWILFFGAFHLYNNLPKGDNRSMVLLMLLLFTLGMVFQTCGIIAGLILIFKMWAAIKGPSARTSPAKAVGFLFIPFFNFYWAFQVFWGWAKDYNKIITERQINAPLMPTGLGLAISIINIFAWTPLCIILVGFIPEIILISIFFAKACNGINALCGDRAN